MTHANADAFASTAIADDGTQAGESGLTKREYFAAQAMSMFTVGSTQDWDIHEDGTADYSVAARACVRYADALIKELNK